MLIYEENPFFRPYQDIGKVPGMFGTLVINLPSEHQGGGVLLSHKKKHYRFESARNSHLVAGTSYIAWYSDVVHELEPVVSGYRVILTYNLIQQAGSALLCAPDEQTVVRLQKTLQTWERLASDQSKKTLPYIAHQLDHPYNYEGPKFEALKGRDFAQVCCLQKACQELGFGLYLATYEKTLHVDEYVFGEVYAHEDDFIDVTDLDGLPTNIKPEFDEACFLKEVSHEYDEDYDQSEHEEYTVDDGSPVNYWYRDSVVIIVPPSQKLAFELSGAKKFETMSKNMRSMRDEAKRNDQVKQTLRRYCQIVLSSRPLTEYSWSKLTGDEAHHKSCLEQVTELTLEHGWLQMFSSIPVAQKRSRICLLAICRFAVANDIDLLLGDMMQILDGRPVFEKYLALKGMTSVLNDSSLPPEKQLGFTRW